MKVTTQTDLRKNIKHLFEEIISDCEPLQIHRKGKDDLIVVPLSEWKAIQETNYLLSTKNNREKLLESIEEFQNGKDKGEKIEIEDLWK